MSEILFFIAGAVVSCVVSYYFFRRGNKETPKWFTVDKIKEIITKKPEDVNWTAKQIVNLYNNKVYSDASGDPLPFKFCPTCGSDKLKRGSHTDTARDEWYCFVECEECGWSDWSQ